MAIDPIDATVGARLRMSRTMMGFSQATVAQHLGITFQQVQKYENGSNRISASRLSAIAQLLGASVSYFFENRGIVPADPIGDYSKEVMSFNKAFAKIESADLRREIISLIEVLANVATDGQE